MGRRPSQSKSELCIGCSGIKQTGMAIAPCSGTAGLVVKSARYEEASARHLHNHVTGGDTAPLRISRERREVSDRPRCHASYSLTRVTCNTLLLAYYSASTATKPWTRSMMRSTASSADLGRSPCCPPRLRYQLAARMQDAASRYGRLSRAGSTASGPASPRVTP